MEILKREDCIIWTPRERISSNHCSDIPLKVCTGVQLIMARGPIRKQQPILTAGNSIVNRINQRHKMNKTITTLWRPLLPYGYSYKASCAKPGWAIICNFWHPGTLTLTAERQSAQMSKFTNYGPTRSTIRYDTIEEFNVDSKAEY